MQNCVNSSRKMPFDVAIHSSQSHLLFHSFYHPPNPEQIAIPNQKAEKSKAFQELHDKS